jgi:heat shock protein HslJ
MNWVCRSAPTNAVSMTVVLLGLAFSSGGAASAPRDGAGTWLLQKGAGLPSRKARKPTLSMQGEKLSGSTGCNTFTATLVRHGDKRVAIDAIALTRMMCEPGQSTMLTAISVRRLASS